MIDWTKSMKQTYEFYIVNPVSGTNISKLDKVTGASVNRDITSDTQVSGSISYDGELGEVYVRIYLVAEQGEEIEKIPLITMLCQSPSVTFNGKKKSSSITGYSPLLELQNLYPPIGYTIPKYDDNKGYTLGNMVFDIYDEYTRVEVLPISEDLTLATADFLNTPYVADPSESWFDLCQKLMSPISYFARVNEDGVIYFDKKKSLSKMVPIWTYDTSNSSIFGSDITVDRDIYSIPNVVEVIATLTDGNTLSVTVENVDESSPTSIPSRGRRVVHREINPDNMGKIAPGNDKAIKDYVYNLLEQANILQYSVSYTHGYCGTNVGDCVYIDYPSAGLNNEKAYVVSQSIDCKTGCTVSETAIMTKNLYERPVDWSD